MMTRRSAALSPAPDWGAKEAAPTAPLMLSSDRLIFVVFEMAGARRRRGRYRRADYELVTFFVKTRSQIRKIRICRGPHAPGGYPRPARGNPPLPAAACPSHAPGARCRRR